MSLINEALKKAQKQRTGENTPLSSIPSIGGEPAARIARREKPVGFNSLMIRLTAIATGLLIIILGTIFTLRLVNEPGTAPIKTATASTTPATKNPPTPTTPVATETTFHVPGVNPPTAPTTQESTPSSSSTTPTLERKPVAPETPPVSPSPSNNGPSIKLAPAINRMDSKAVAYIEGLRIAGIRASATDSKVLMNDRVYRAGDTVEHELGLKLVAITPNSLTFENETGARYTRNF